MLFQAFVEPFHFLLFLNKQALENIMPANSRRAKICRRVLENDVSRALLLRGDLLFGVLL
jgi:hypothetical protein